MWLFKLRTQTLFLSDFNEETDFRKILKIFYENLCSGSRVVSCGRTDGQDAASGGLLQLYSGLLKQKAVLVAAKQIGLAVNAEKLCE